MSVAKVIEITASSPTSFAEAAKAGIAKASETVHGIKGAWVSEESLVVEKPAHPEPAAGGGHGHSHGGHGHQHGPGF